MSKKVALILSGSGVMDGTEIGEAICSILSIEGEGFSWDGFALNEEQNKVVCHKTKKELAEKRNMMAEAGRITRTKIQSIDDLDVSKYDILWIPGGFGVASSLSNLAEKGVEATVHPKISKIIKAFHKGKKVIVGVCIAPALIARVLFDKNLILTLGMSDDLSKQLQQFGITSKKEPSSNFIFDKVNNLYTTPAYMNEDAELNTILTTLRNITKHINS